MTDNSSTATVTGSTFSGRSTSVIMATGTVLSAGRAIYQTGKS